MASGCTVARQGREFRRTGTLVLRRQIGGRVHRPSDLSSDGTVARSLSSPAGASGEPEGFSLPAGDGLHFITSNAACVKESR